MTDETQPVPRITRIEVTGLFGLYDHVINLNLEDRVTILHGPNGVGKTVLLRMIRAVLTSQENHLARFPFQRFCVDFTFGESIDIRSEVRTIDASNGRRARRIKTLKNANAPDSAPCEFRQRTTYASSAIFDDLNERRFPSAVWVAEETNGLLWNPFAERPPVHFIEAERLSLHINSRKNPGASPPLYPSVWGDAIDLQRQIGVLSRAYVDAAQGLDPSFPTRLVQRTGQGLPLEDLKHRMSDLEALRAALQQNGILDEPRVKPFDVTSLDGLSPAQMDVMALYVEDNEKKLGTFTKLLQRVELFLRIINARFRNKTLRVDHRQGLVIVDHHGQPLELRSLSSGEQQQIVLYYDLLFRASPNTLVLIDEPELSWHILWQKRFLPDLLEIVKVASIDTLIATHSPFIVGDRSDLMIAIDAEIDHDEPLPT